MSEQKYEAGTLAMIKFIGSSSRDGNEWKMGIKRARGWSWLSGAYPADFVRVEVRPLAVIDPEDRERAKRLVEAYYEDDSTDAPSAMQAALRKYATSAKPDEPTGLGAVAREPGKQSFVRRGYRSRFTFPWVNSNDPSDTRNWSHFTDDVEVLFEGVQP